MTVSNQQTVFVYVGNGVTVTFPYSCQVQKAEDLQAYVNDSAITGGITKNGIGNLSGGSVTFSVPPASGASVRLERVVVLERTTDYQQNGDFLSRVVNPDFDRIWMALQQFSYSFTRFLRFPNSDINPTTELPPASARANNLLGFDELGRPVAIAPAAQSATALQALLATTVGASIVNTSTGDSVQAWIDYLRSGGAAVHADQFLGTSNPIINAINALPASGGIVFCSARRYPPVNTDYDTNRMAKNNIFLVGARMPFLSDNADRLEGGTIIEGRFNGFAHNFGVENIGFDCGKYVVDTYYGGVDTHTANHPLGNTWDAFAFAQPPVVQSMRRGFYAQNCIGLCRDSLSLGHAFLIEGVDGGYVDNVTAVYGVHGVVIKSKNIRIGSIAGYMQSSQGALFKSDTLGVCENVTVDTVEANRNAPGITPWSAPPIPAFGIFVNPASNNISQIQISLAKAMGCDRALNFDGAVGKTGADIQIDNLQCDGFTGTMDYGVISQNATFERVQIGKTIINNSNQGFYWSSSDPLVLDSVRLTQIANHAMMAIGAGVIRAGVVKFKTCGSAYYSDDAARIYIDDEDLVGVTTKFFRSPPSLAANWANNGGSNSTYEMMLRNYKVEIKGLVKASAGAGATIAGVPPYMSPPKDKRFLAYLNNGTRSSCLIGVTTSGAVVLNDVTAPTVNDYVSLDGIAWEY